MRLMHTIDALSPDAGARSQGWRVCLDKDSEFAQWFHFRECLATLAEMV
jgi:hypothetical protein